jgi:hypothetical protein
MKEKERCGSKDKKGDKRDQYEVERIKESKNQLKGKT